MEGVQLVILVDLAVAVVALPLVLALLETLHQLHPLKETVEHLDITPPHSLAAGVAVPANQVLHIIHHFQIVGVLMVGQELRLLLLEHR